MNPVFAIQTAPQISQIVDKAMFLSVEIFQLVNQEEITELEYHDYAIPREMMDQSNDSESLLKLFVEKWRTF